MKLNKRKAVSPHVKKQQSGCLFTPRSQTFSSATTDRVPAVSFNCFKNVSKFKIHTLIFNDFIHSNQNDIEPWWLYLTRFD